MTIPKFSGLAEVKAMLKKLEQASDNNQAAAGMTTIGLLAAAMVKIVDEIEELKATQSKD